MARLIVALALASIVFATMTVSPTRSGARPVFHCFFCGERDTADLARNLVLFAPLGAGLALVGWPTLRIALACGALSAGVETAQLAIPGRHPSPEDVLSNALGGVAGAWALAALLWGARRASPDLAARLSLVLALVAAGVWQLPLWLAAPSLPPTPYYAHLNHQVEHLARWDGRVVDARLGRLDLADGRLPDSARARRLLLDGAPLEVVGVAGARAPTGLTGIFFVSDERQREILLVAARGDELLVRLRTRAADARLEWPTWRAPGALAGIRPGDPLRLRVTREGPRVCVRGAGISACPLGFRAGDGWMLWISGDEVAAGWREALAAVWLGAWALPVGLLVRRRAASALALGTLAAALLVAPERLGGLATPPLQALGALTGVLIGWGLRVGLGREGRGEQPAPHTPAESTRGATRSIEEP